MTQPNPLKTKILDPLPTQPMGQPNPWTQQANKLTSTSYHWSIIARVARLNACSKPSIENLNINGRGAKVARNFSLAIHSLLLYNNDYSVRHYQVILLWQDATAHRQCTGKERVKKAQKGARPPRRPQHAWRKYYLSWWWQPCDSLWLFACWLKCASCATMRNCISTTSRVIANFVLKFPHFRYHGNKGRSEEKSMTSTPGFVQESVTS